MIQAGDPSSFRIFLADIIKRRDRKPVSVLSCHLSSQPTPWHRTGSPHLPVYLVLQAPDPYPCGVTDADRGLLPHIFTLAIHCLAAMAVVFCYGCQKISPICDFRSGVPFPVRTFLLRRTGSDRSSRLYHQKPLRFNRLQSYQFLFDKKSRGLILYKFAVISQVCCKVCVFTFVVAVRCQHKRSCRRSEGSGAPHQPRSGSHRRPTDREH